MSDTKEILNQSRIEQTVHGRLAHELGVQTMGRIQAEAMSEELSAALQRALGEKAKVEADLAAMKAEQEAATPAEVPVSHDAAGDGRVRPPRRR